MSGWGCPHEIRGECQRVRGRHCDPGMKGCILHGRFVFANPDKNRQRRRGSQAPTSSEEPPSERGEE